MTRTFLKKKFTLKKYLWSETEVYADSGSIICVSAIIKIHPTTIQIPLKGETKGIRDCSQ